MFKGIAMKNLILLVLFAIISGCSTRGLVEDSYTSSSSTSGLVKDLYARGAMPSSTAKLVVTGSEADVGSDIQVVITDKDVIRRVWHSILNSKPYARFPACGVQKIEFYSKLDSSTPLATLTVHCGGIDSGDAVHVEGVGPFPWDSSKGGRVGLYKCEGLHLLVLKYLREEYEERNEYLREMPNIVSDFEANPEDSKLEFECFYYKPRKAQKGDMTYLWAEKVTIASEKIPKPTADLTRHLIRERFLSKPETWSDGFFGDSKYIKATLWFVPIQNYYKEKFPEIWNYALAIHSYHPQDGIGKTVWGEGFLCSKNGYILYRGENDSWNYGYVKRGENGIFIDIIDDFSSPRVTSADVTGIVTEYFYEFGGKELVKLKESNERVEVLTYLNNYFDGKFWNGKK